MVFQTAATEKKLKILRLKLFTPSGCFSVTNSNEMLYLILGLKFLVRGL